MIAVSDQTRQIAFFMSDVPMRVARAEWAGKRIDAFCRKLNERCRGEVRLVRSGIAAGTFVVEPGCEEAFARLAASYDIAVTFFDAGTAAGRLQGVPPSDENGHN